MLSPRQLHLLKDILRQPAAPFREQHVVRCVCNHLQDAGVPYYFDATGNIVVGVNSETEYRRLLNMRDKEPVRVFIAHMDHPGFHGLRWVGKERLAIQWHGGSPVKHLAGAKIWLANDEGELGQGRLSKVSLSRAGWSINKAEVRFTRGTLHSLTRHKAKTLFGGFAFRSHYWIRGKRLYTRAADDLTGVFCIVETAISLFRKPNRKKLPFIGLLTRAEEVGFVGAVNHLQNSPLTNARRPLMCVSLEASRTLPGAVIGKGPVVRLGDRRTTFDSGGLQVLSTLAEKILPGAHQRRVMDGGSCEATAATAWGLPTIGITLPLGNYHNQGFEGGLDCLKSEGPAPEFVHLEDIAGELKLCQALMSCGLEWADPWSGIRSRLIKNASVYKSAYILRTKS